MMTETKYKVGERHKNRSGQWYTIISYNKKRNYNKTFIVEFDSGYVTYARTSRIRIGNIKDKYIPTFCGVGYLGVTLIKDRKLLSPWRRMIARCYNKTNNSYQHGRVLVCERWHCYENFRQDVKKLKHFDYSKLRIGVGKSLELDKDIIGTGKLYSPENCIWATRQENCKAKRKYGVGYKYIDLKGFRWEVIEYINNMNIVIKCLETGFKKKTYVSCLPTRKEIK
jgi:hypothetical protein